LTSLERDAVPGRVEHLHDRVGGRVPGIGGVLELDVEAGFRDRPGELAAGRLRRGGEVVALGRALEEIDDPLAPKLRHASSITSRPTEAASARRARGSPGAQPARRAGLAA